MTLARLKGSAALAALIVATPALAQDRQDPPQPAEAVSSEDILVTGEIFFRNRTTDPNPVLSYDLEYFQRFEPVSVGEMLKRVPGVTFTSDVLEYDGVQMRGLPPGFTQILINGRRAPGGEADGSFFVDRIPAELVERIEIVRSPRADEPSDGIAGTLNVITKESATFTGGFAKLGALINGADGEIRPSGAIAYAGKLDEQTSFWGALNYQERRNPKHKVSYRFKDVPVTEDDRDFPGDPSTSPWIDDPEFDDFEDQRDTRDGTDLSGSAEITSNLANGARIRLSGFFVDTNRDEDETSVTLKDSDLEFDGVEKQHEDISQQTYALDFDVRTPLSETLELGLAAGWNAYRENTDITVFEGDNEDDLDDVTLEEEDTINIRDNELTGTAFLAWEGNGLRVKGGIDFLSKKRDGLNDGTFATESFTIDETRYNPYVRVTYDLGSALTIDGGLRYQLTDRTVTATTGAADYNQGTLNPSLHVRYSVTDVDQVRFSVARTVRRPDYDLLSPTVQPETPGDDDLTIGNPYLRNQMAWGVDLGYERRLGRSGIFGVNFFYRDITDLIELVPYDIPNRTAAEGEFRPENIGDGQAWGVEIDLSAPVNIFSFGETGLFANYTYLDSKTIDPFTGEERQFNNQPHHVYNVGFIQNVAPAGVSFGATVSGRSEAFESNFDEDIHLRYDPDLEAFIEKRFGSRFVLRFSAQNLLDRVKYEDFRKYDGDFLEDILANRAAGDIDEYEIEREHSGPLYQVTLRAAF